MESEPHIAGLVSPAEFDQFAGNYDSALNQGLSISGETKGYFATGRIAWLARCLSRRRWRFPANTPTEPSKIHGPDMGFFGNETTSKVNSNFDPSGPVIIDYGCGIGSSLPALATAFSAARVLGLDVSTSELAIARQQHCQSWASFQHVNDYVPDASADLIYCNGTFHHIPPFKRPEVMQYLHRALKPGGYFSFWENNPWNPGTRYVMSRIPFDRDAITLFPSGSRCLVRSCGFEVVSTTFMFVFPRMLSALRACEPMLSGLPIGAQYQVLCRKGGTDAAM